MRLIRPSVLALLTASTLSAMLLVGCGGGSGGGGGGAGTGSSSTATAHSLPGQAAAFAWLHPAPPPPGWSLARLGGSVALAYPSSWRRIHSDPGTVSAARTNRGSDLIADYLNVTPQQGEETLQNWARFRPAHNVEEGDSHVQLLAAGRDLHFRDGRGSCVIDRYRTPATTYQEIACLVRGPRSANVIVAAGLAARWAHDAPALERAISAFLA